MTRGIFLAGNESPLFSAAAAEAENRVEKYAAALIYNPAAVSGKPGESGSAKRISLVWNPASSISSRTLLLSAENWLGQINDALLICMPPASFCPAESIVPAEIETQVNIQIKGWFYLVRELALYFRARGSGTLALVIPETVTGGRESLSDFFGAPAAASFRALAQELLSGSAAEPFHVLGFTLSEAGQEKEFTAWMYKILDEGARRNSGKWHKFSKLKLFQNFGF
ncbi:MAG: hypothetical protein FWF22_03760 [Treponema sp.]|nr:hypothetical protein [Treponema sp.]